MALQEEINNLYNLASRLLRIESSGGYLFADDLPQLNKEIHHKISELYLLHGSTTEQEASLCLAILMGYSVMIYANSEDEIRRNLILERSRKLLEVLAPGSLKDMLLNVYKEYVSF